ncbi:Ribonuclease HII [Chlorella sorokiniana]|uniref:Ribonuclease n=1 Tax=Chlorella sorokiniana TaxID=3076 RepID=A0A2P6TID1_CHLSO|nr:Ribonuclease HII [Chlorella sorokiniana]|eukprot:PRW34053.1 Ribonuclease HII [Chlorella sorokiniana]
MRRASRSLARAASGEEAAAAVDAATVELPAEQPRKRPRRAAAAAAAQVVKAEADAAAGSDAEGEGAAAPAAKGRGRAAKLKALGPTRELEAELWQQGYASVAGVDEAGRGPLAGPVVAAACVVPAHVEISGIDDSKKLSAEQREALYEQLTTHPEVLWAAKVIEASEIDEINILQAAMKAMEGAAAGLRQKPDFLLVDGNRLPKAFDPERARPVVKGDSKSFCIAAASVIAKVTRDRLMLALHKQYPQYNFAGHKGYCVPEHVEAIRQHGPCPQHRRTFAPIKTWYPLEKKAEEGQEAAGAAAGSKGKKAGGRGRKPAKGSS